MQASVKAKETRPGSLDSRNLTPPASEAGSRVAGGHICFQHMLRAPGPNSKHRAFIEAAYTLYLADLREYCEVLCTGMRHTYRIALRVALHSVLF